MKKKQMKKEVVKHLKGDMKGYKEEYKEDAELLKKLGKKSTKKRKRDKVGVVMEEFEEGRLHSGSKKGPIVTNPKQGIAIALSYSKKKKGTNEKRKRR